MKRRDFLFGTAAAASGLVVLPSIWGCKKEDDQIPIESANQFKYLEVSGTNYEVGKQIGQYFSKEIMGSQLAIGDFLNSINQIIESSRETFYDPFLEAAQTHYPDYVDELQGIADGAGKSFENIFIGNIFMEVMYKYLELTGEKKYTLSGDLGCSSVAYSKNGKSFLTHNEDLFTSFINYLYLLKIKVTGKPEILTLSYPGLLPGIPPGMNEAGIVQSGNDICGLHIEDSVPMALHFRSVLDATSLDDAVERAKNPHRARTMTHNIGSFVENKIVSVEAAPNKNQSKIVDGFLVHTNHFVFSNMKDIIIDENSLPSSVSRFNKLTTMSNAYANKPSDVNGELISSFLSSHEGDFSPCVHDRAGASTLCHSVFDFQNKSWKLYFSNPCMSNSKIVNK
jgi:hypothetical protein